MQKALLTVTDVKAFISDALSSGMLVNKKQLSKHFNISVGVLSKYIEKGMPWVGNPRQKKFIIADVEEWLVRQGIKEPL